MGSKTDEVFAQAVQDLRSWVEFLESKRSEYQEQVERARRNASSSSDSSKILVEEEEQALPQANPSKDGGESWMDALSRPVTPAPAAETGKDNDDSWV